jgi:hypothetical protein
MLLMWVYEIEVSEKAPGIYVLLFCRADQFALYR